MTVLVTTYLEMTGRGAFKPAFSPDPMLTVMRANVPLPAFYRFLYRGVGGKWRWRDRESWSDEQLRVWLSAPTTALFVLYVNGTPAGYIELDQQPAATEVAYFGLLEEFGGRGYGKHLLSYGVQHAWDSGATRVWLHTCNLDAPAALATYQKCGFSIYEVREEPLPEKYA